jgi:hypothetical protein
MDKESKEIELSPQRSNSEQQIQNPIGDDMVDSKQQDGLVNPIIWSWTFSGSDVRIDTRTSERLKTEIKWVEVKEASSMTFRSTDELEIAAFQKKLFSLSDIMAGFGLIQCFRK